MIWYDRCALSGTQIRLLLGDRDNNKSNMLCIIFQRPGGEEGGFCLDRTPIKIAWFLCAWKVFDGNLECLATEVEYGEEFNNNKKKSVIEMHWRNSVENLDFQFSFFFILIRAKYAQSSTVAPVTGRPRSSWDVNGAYCHIWKVRFHFFISCRLEGQQKIKNENQQRHACKLMV